MPSSYLIIAYKELKVENEELRKKLKKVRKEKKRWKNKYLELLHQSKIQEWLESMQDENDLKPTNPIKSRVKPGSMDELYEV